MKFRLALFTLVLAAIAFLACQSAEMTSAKVYIQQKNYPAALEQLRTAAEKEPTNPAVFLTMGKLYAEMDSLDEMNRAFDTVLELDSVAAKDIRAWRLDKRAEYFNKGLKYGEDEKWEKAISNTETAVKIDPEYADGWKNLAYLYEQSGDKEKTAGSYLKAYELEPLNLLFAKQVAVNSFNEGEKERAIEILTKIKEEGEPDVEVYLLLQRILLSDGREDEALTILVEAEEKFPDNTDILFDHGALLFSAFDNYEEAAVYFERVIELDPNNTDALYNLTVTLYKADKFQESADKGEILVKNDPQNLLGWVQFAISLKRAGDTKKGSAAESVAKALQNMEDKKYTLDDLKKAFELGRKIMIDVFNEDGDWEFYYDDFDSWFNDSF